MPPKRKKPQAKSPDAKSEGGLGGRPTVWQSKIVGHDRVDPEQLLAHPLNYRRHPQAQREALTAAIKEVGFIRSITVNKQTGHIVDGHERAWQAMHLKQPWIDVEYVDLTPEEEAKALATMDPISEMALVDKQLLEQLLVDVQTDDAGLNAMLEDLKASAITLPEDWNGEHDAAERPTEVTEDDVPELPMTPVTKPGDLWLLGEHRLLCGDATNAESVQVLMAGDIADLCFTSPPYGLGSTISLRSKVKSDRTSAYDMYDDDPASWGELMAGWFSASCPHVQSWAINLQLLAGNKRAMINWLEKVSDRLVDVAIWDKINGCPAMAASVLNSRFEFLIILGQVNATRSIPFSSWRGTVDNLYSGPPNRDRQFSEVHKAIMPMHLPGHILGVVFDRCKTIYEPFAGTGTTIIAAEQLNRRCYAMEISPAYCDVAVKRWENLTGRKAVLAK